MPISSLSLPDVSHLEVEDAKQVLRRHIREHRKQRSDSARGNMAVQWAETVKEFVGDAQTVAAYVSIKEEPPTSAVCEALAGKNLLLPKLGPGLSRAWGWYRGASDLSVQAPSRPPEPSGEALDSSILETVDVLIIPALAVSEYGERLGQGGGWYDRVLKEVSPHTRVGAMVFPEEFIEGHLPQEPMDVRIGWVIHPKKIREIEK